MVPPSLRLQPATRRSNVPTLHLKPKLDKPHKGEIYALSVVFSNRGFQVLKDFKDEG